MMQSLIEGTWAIIAALSSGDSWMISDALRNPAAYLLGIPVVICGGYLFLLLLKQIPFMDKYFERTVLVGLYLTIATVIFVEVIRRFVFQVQAPWSTTLPPYLFLIMTWVACAANVKTRSHLSFSEFRNFMPRKMQFGCLCLDTILWLTFSVVVVTTTFRQAANSASNFQILLGTDNVLQWWFYIFVPISWLLLSARVLENFSEDIKKLKSGAPLLEQSAIGSE
tara:strand:- start:2031 stop:2702 length:672 start_codon:yes stop_codon:yes gene_type:complete